tara:strand:+ start:11296 stop:11508 length:213 start_codon:yes stop_codon:yes gene_type:complete
MEWWNRLHILTKIAFICLVLGKIHFIPATLSIFAAYEYATFFLVVYTVFILAAAILSLVRIRQIIKESKT